MKLRREDEAWLFASATRAEWDDLVADAACDPLFNGWAWRSSWWRYFGAAIGGRVVVLTLRDDADRLLAVLPLYHHRAKLRGIPVRRLQLLGGHARGEVETEFSEYGDACVRRGFEAIAAEIFVPALLELGWHDFLALCVREDAWLARYLVPALRETSLRLRWIDPLRHYAVDLAAGYSAWRDGLSANARRRAIGQRAKLAAPRLEDVGTTTFGAFIDELNALQVQRWGKPVYSMARRAFHADLIAALPPDALRASRLGDGDTTHSLLYDLRLAGREYNLQSAFVAEGARGLSPGYLHIGYAIEAAARDGVACFDLLAGPGKHRDYKADLAVAGGDLHTLHVLRAPWLKALAALRGE